MVAKAMKTQKNNFDDRKKNLIVINVGFLGKPTSKELGFVTSKGDALPSSLLDSKWV